MGREKREWEEELDQFNEEQHGKIQTSVQTDGMTLITSL